MGRAWLRGWDSNPRFPAYEAGEMPLLYPAIYTVDKPRAYGVAPNVFVTVLKSAPVQALASSKLPVLFCSAGWHGGT